MNIFTLNGFSVARDRGNTVIEVRETTFEISLTDDVLNYSAVSPPIPGANLPILFLNDPADLQLARVDGVDITAQARVSNDFSLGFVDTPEGRHVIVALFDEATNTDFFYQIGGDPLTQPTNVAAWNALEASITGIGTASGTFAPNQDIPLTAFDNTTLSSAQDGEPFFGTNADNFLAGGAGDDTLAGLGGNDNLSGAAGDDSINGGAGDDNIAASTGNDTVEGGDGADSIGGGTGDDLIDAGVGNDVIGAGLGDDSANGGDGNDVVSGGAGNDSIDGGDGNDSMGGSFGNDEVSGGLGNDDMGGGAGRDTVDAGAGDDSVGGGEGDDVILGGDGADFLAGGGRNDEIDGGAGDDSINGGDGDDMMQGGTGADVFVFNFFKDGDADVITDYEDGTDSFLIRTVNPDTGEINLDNGGLGLQGFVGALGITDTGGGAQMTIGGHLVLVEGIAAADLTVDDFQFI